MKSTHLAACTGACRALGWRYGGTISLRDPRCLTAKQGGARRTYIEVRPHRRVGGLNHDVGHMFSVNKLKQGQDLSQLDAVPCPDGD